MIRAPGRISTAWEYQGDGGSVPDLMNRTADFSLTFGVSFVWFVFREPEKIDAAVRHTRMKAIRMLSLLLRVALASRHQAARPRLADTRVTGYWISVTACM